MTKNVIGFPKNVRIVPPFFPLCAGGEGRVSAYLPIFVTESDGFIFFRPALDLWYRICYNLRATAVQISILFVRGMFPLTLLQPHHSKTFSKEERRAC